MKKFFIARNLIAALICGVLIGELALVSSVAATAPPNCVIGDIGPGGGIVFYVSSTKINVRKGISSGGRCLEAAPNTWAGTASDPTLRWGCQGTSTPSTGFGIGTGASNTARIMASCGASNIAARRAANLSFNGKSDWFLPSRGELSLMYANLHSAGVGGFVASTYWTSSSASAWDAWIRSFIGIENYFSKLSLVRVRPVRAFG